MFRIALFIAMAAYFVAFAKGYFDGLLPATNAGILIGLAITTLGSGPID